jgi:hypothetical protein
VNRAERRSADCAGSLIHAETLQEHLFLPPPFPTIILIQLVPSIGPRCRATFLGFRCVSKSRGHPC